MAHSALDSCVRSLATTSESLRGTISFLGESVNDYNRLTTLLQNKRHFELVTEMDIYSAQKQIASEVEPRIRSLLTRCEKLLARQERKLISLRSKAELQEMKLRQLPSFGTRITSGKIPENDVESRKLRSVISKKERLAKSIERLDAEIASKEKILVRESTDES